MTVNCDVEVHVLIGQTPAAEARSGRVEPPRPEIISSDEPKSSRMLTIRLRVSNQSASPGVTARLLRGADRFLNWMRRLAALIAACSVV